MNILKLFIDNSTTPRNGRYGPSTIAWAAWWDETHGLPVKCGILYICKEGPNIAFYEGIIRALESCLWMIEQGDTVEIYGDCELVINQLSGKWKVNHLRKFYEQVGALQRKITNQKGALISYNYVSENDNTYRKIDQLSKRAFQFIKQVLK